MTEGTGKMPRKPMAVLMITALGVVYGDIGTSPLYTLQECFHGPHAIEVNPVNVLGVLSLIFWSLTVIITVKYIGFVTKADNHGEGGTFALLALLRRFIESAERSVGHAAGRSVGRRIFRALPYLSLCSGALLYSDGIITPAISVLSAVEGVGIIAPAASGLIVPGTCVILFMLFMLQKRGTARIGGLFGPVMLLWFCTLAGIGLYNVWANPFVLFAISPQYAISYFVANHFHGIIVLGTVVLCMTGGEALYADLGHFSRSPIRNGWLMIACPALLLNYFGQGALILSTQRVVHNPFYQAVPAPLLVPMVILATMATVIASQSMITGVYSLTQQAVNLGFLPRMRVVHTSPDAKGQIYLPTINALLMVACLSLVLIFRNSGGLAAAYGLAATGAMGMTSILFFMVSRFVWRWSLFAAVPLLVLFLFFELPFLGANLIKVVDGGWLPMLAAVILITVMTTWKKGRAHLKVCFERMSMPLAAFLASLRQVRTNRSPGIGIFMTMNQNLTPMPLARSIALIHTVPETIVLLTIHTAGIPYVPTEQRVKLDESDKDVGVYRMTASYGYMQRPDMEDISECSRTTAMHLPLYDSTFYLGRETILASAEEPVMRPWRRALFIFLSNNAWNASTFFNIPTSRVVEIGTHLPL